MRRALIGLVLGAALAACGGEEATSANVEVSKSDLVQFGRYGSNGNNGPFADVDVASYESQAQPSNSFSELESQDVDVFDVQNHNPAQVGDTLIIQFIPDQNHAGRAIMFCLFQLPVFGNGIASDLDVGFPSSFNGFTRKPGSGFQYVNAQYPSGTGPLCSDEGGATFHISQITAFPASGVAFQAGGALVWRVDFDYPSFNITRQHFGNNAGAF